VGEGADERNRLRRAERMLRRVLAALGGLLIVSLLSSVVPGLITDRAAPEPPPPPAPMPMPPPVAAQVPVVPAIELVLRFRAASWLEARVDGVATESGRVVAAGEELRLTAQDTVELRFGNAGGVDVRFNGEELGAAGRVGEVVRVTYGRNGPIAR
jgi:hypothetical protein